jgi:molybdenum cofactor cytidylyltransferase
MEKIYAVILAAGTSSRLGFNKLTLKIDGQSVIQMATEPFIIESICKILIVTNPDYSSLKREVDELKTQNSKLITAVCNPDYIQGMSSSIKAVTPFIQGADTVFFQLGDKPFIKKEMVEQMIELYVNREKNLFDIIVPVYRGKKGHPVLMDIKPYIKEMQNLEGDKGLREIIDNHSGSVLFIEGDEGNIFDIDTEGEIHTLRERGYVIEKD